MAIGGILGYKWHVFHFDRSLSTRFEILTAPQPEIDMILDQGHRPLGGSMQFAFPNDANIGKFAYASVASFSNRRIYYRFSYTGGDEIIWIKSSTIRYLTGKLWRMEPHSTIYLSVENKNQYIALTEHEVLTILSETKVMGILLRMQVAGGTAAFWVPPDN